MRTLTAALILSAIAFLGLVPANAVEAPHTIQEPLRRPVATTSTTEAPRPTTPPISVLEASDGQSCPGWMELARQVGWPESELPMVGAVTYFESRCRMDVRGDHGHSWTAYQLHTKSWCRPNRYYPDGYLQSLRIVNTCEDLLDPTTATRAALAIWQYGGWKQWTTWQKASTTIGQ
jgi:hypothetical protein